MSEETQAWIGLGGNLGDVPATLAEARRALAACSTRPLRASSLYGSAPWGGGANAGPDYVNQVVEMWTRASPEALLSTLLEIEARNGRVREVGIRWASRTLDLDLLAMGALTRETPTLSLPHPRLAARRFVLLPWAELAGDFRVCGLESTVSDLLASCPDPGPCWPLSV